MAQIAQRLTNPIASSPADSRYISRELRALSETCLPLHRHGNGNALGHYAMHVVEETPKTAEPVRFNHAAALAPAGEKPNPKRQTELFAWILIAGIWGTFAFALYLIWVKATAGV